MTIRELQEKLMNIKEELQDKDIKVMASNGNLIPPEINYILKDGTNINKDATNVSFVLLGAIK